MRQMQPGPVISAITTPPSGCVRIKPLSSSLASQFTYWPVTELKVEARSREVHSAEVSPGTGNSAKYCKLVRRPTKSTYEYETPPSAVSANRLKQAVKGQSACFSIAIRCIMFCVYLSKSCRSICSGNFRVPRTTQPVPLVNLHHFQNETR